MTKAPSYSLSDEALLELHKTLVEIPSPSHHETEIADFAEQWLRQLGAEVWRVENNVVARAGKGPRLLLNSHLDTVPATEQWTHEPHRVHREGDRLFGLGSNDAKAPVAAMMSAFAEVVAQGGPCDTVLMLVPEEETGGRGTEIAWPDLRDKHEFLPGGVVVGEPTGLNVATSQKGLLILRMVAEGDACHSANATAQNARNPIFGLSRDIVALSLLELGEAHPALGATTLQPTVISAGERRNVVPGQAEVWLDLRTVPSTPHSELLERIQSAVESKVLVHSDRLHPRECPKDARLLVAAKAARPKAEFYGSRTMSDLVYFDGVPAIKVGPGETSRSHTADEFVLASEVLDGRSFYWKLIERFAEVAS